MDDLKRIEEYCEAHRIKDMKNFMGAVPYDNEKSARLSSLYEFKGISTCEVSGGEVMRLFSYGKESIAFN